MSTPPDGYQTLQAPQLPPRDYSAAYVDELVTQLESEIQMLQIHLDMCRTALVKIRPQVNPH